MPRKSKPETMKAKRTLLDKLASEINRISSGQPKGRKETDPLGPVYKRLRKTPSKKSPPVRKDKPGSGALAKRRKQTIEDGINGRSRSKGKR